MTSNFDHQSLIHSNLNYTNEDASLNKALAFAQTLHRIAFGFLLKFSEEATKSKKGVLPCFGKGVFTKNVDLTLIR